MPREVLDDFEKQFNVEIVYDVYPSNEDMFREDLGSGLELYNRVWQDIRMGN